MTITATVLQVNPQGLLVRNEATGEEIQVNVRNSNRFSVGERLRITFRGQMTFSIPPQVTATSIQRLQPPRPTPPRPAPQPPAVNEIRGVVVQRGNGFLTVRENRTNRQFRVEYPFAHHFCVRQQIIVRHDTITLTNPPRVTAIDINPVC